MVMEALRVEGLSKQFGGVRAVNNVSFSVSVGERLAIIGPNGAGKTTLLNLINGQLPVTTGRIYFFGQDVTTLTIHQRANLGQARTFQIISLLQRLTVFDNTLLALHGTKSSRFSMFRPVEDFREVFNQARDFLKALELWGKKDELIKNLAYGEQRRLEIGLGIAVRPKVLLLDEASAGLSREESFDTIAVIKNLGGDITVLLVDHDMEMVFEVAERIIVLHNGQIIADGAPEKIQADVKVKEIYMGFEEHIDYAGVG